MVVVVVVIGGGGGSFVFVFVGNFFFFVVAHTAGCAVHAPTKAHHVAGQWRDH